MDKIFSFKETINKKWSSHQAEGIRSDDSITELALTDHSCLLGFKTLQYCETKHAIQQGGHIDAFRGIFEQLLPRSKVFLVMCMAKTCGSGQMQREIRAWLYSRFFPFAHTRGNFLLPVGCLCLWEIAGAATTIDDQ